MAKLVSIKGIPQIMAKMDIHDKKVEAGLARGLKIAGLRLQRESQKVVPIDTTNLKTTAFTRNMGGAGAKTDIWVGYTAGYAIYVHELIHNQHKEGKQAKFLEGPAREYRNVLLDLIAKSVY